MMRRLGRLLANLALLLALTAAAVTASAVWFATHPPLQTAGVLVVLGGKMDETNSLAEQTRHRVEAAVRLYEAGAAPRLHFTGGTPGKGQPGAGAQMRDLAISLGVPPGVATAESLSESTLQNALFSRPVLGPLAERPVMLVSDGFHLARAWASFRWAGYGPVRLAAASAFGDEATPEQLRWLAREALAWWFNLARVAAFEAVTLVRGEAPVSMLR